MLYCANNRNIKMGKAKEVYNVENKDILTIKDFLYLDTDYLNSYLAQINNGLVDSVHAEIADGNTSTNTKHNPVSSGAEITADFKLIKSRLELPSGYEEAIFSESESFKELTNKIMHDNSYQLFCNFLDKNNLLTNLTEPTVGEYIKISGDFKILDLSIFSDDIIAFMEKASKETHQKYKKQLNDFKNQGNNLKGADKVAFDKEIKKLEAELKKTNQDSYKDALVFIRSFFPSDLLLQSGNFFCFLNPQCFRQSLRGISFKYGNNLNVLGRITRKGLPASADSLNSKELLTILDGIQSQVVSMLNGFGFSLTEDTYILSPVAIYFE